MAPTDLTVQSQYKKGAAPHDILRSIPASLDGTPMPSYSANFEGSEDNAWHLVNYLLSLSPDPSR